MCMCVRACACACACAYEMSPEGLARTMERGRGKLRLVPVPGACEVGTQLTLWRKNDRPVQGDPGGSPMFREGGEGAEPGSQSPPEDPNFPKWLSSPVPAPHVLRKSGRCLSSQVLT